MAISLHRLAIYLYSAHLAVIFAIAFLFLVGGGVTKQTGDDGVRRWRTVYNKFLADRTNGRGYATVLRVASVDVVVVCDVMYCG